MNKKYVPIHPTTDSHCSIFYTCILQSAILNEIFLEGNHENNQLVLCHCDVEPFSALHHHLVVL